MASTESTSSWLFASRRNRLRVVTFIALVGLFLALGPLHRLWRGAPAGVGSSGAASPPDVERIVTLSKSPVPFVIMGLDGSDERLVGVNPETRLTMNSHVLNRYFPDFSSISDKICTKGFTPNIEEIVKLDPHVVFHWEMYHDTIGQLREFGLDVVPIPYDGSEKTDRELVNRIAAAIGREEKAADIIHRREQTMLDIEAITRTIPPQNRPKAIFLYSVEDWNVGGEQCYEAFSIDLIGGRSVVEGLGIGRRVNIEQILQWDPDFLFFGGWRTPRVPADIYQDRLLGAVSAVENRRVFKMPVWSSNEAVLIWQWMAELLHPDAFDFDVREAIEQTYAWQYDIDLTDDDVDKMLFYDVNAISSGYTAFNR